MEISVVTSAYKKEKVVIQQLTRLYSFMGRRYDEFEIILVIDGRLDSTEKLVKDFIKTNGYSNLRILVNPENMGKGYSLRKGLRFATGDIVMTVDADLDIKMRTLSSGLNRLKRGDVSVITPSKYHEDSENDATIMRHIMSKGLQIYSRLFLAVPKGVEDISCGMKIYTREAIDTLLPRMQVHRFAIDSEMFYWMNYYGLKVASTPFYVSIQEGSTAANLKQIFITMKDIFLVGITTRLYRLGLKGFPGAMEFHNYIYAVANI